MKLSIGTLAIVGVAAVTAASIGVMSGLIVRAHEAALIAQVTRSADQLSETIASSTYWDMLENRRDAVHREITTIGRQQGIDKVRLFNADGTIVFSSDEAEKGRAVETAAHTRIYRAADGHRVLGMVRPIRNEQSCWAADCHAHARTDTVLGVLDIDLSLASADAQIAHDQRQMWLLALLAIAASSLLLWWLSGRFLLRPVAALIAGTRRVARGDLSTAIPVQGGKELADLAGAFNDMTVRLSEAQRQLTQSDKLASVGRLAAGVAHEINNPLTGVLTYASFLEKRMQGDPAVQGDLQVIVRETKRCREIVRGLLDFARQTPPKRLPTDVNEVVRRAATVIMNQLSLARVTLEFDLAPELLPIPADANQLQQVAVNLLLNAADAVTDAVATDRKIAVRTRRVDVPPRGHAVIREASCPRGCDLLDKSVRTAGLPTIRVLRRLGEREIVVQLDPVYGRGNDHASEPCPEGAVPTHACPTCRARLEFADWTCADCGAPMYGVDTHAFGRVAWCARKGCAACRWDAMDALGAQPYVELAVEDTGCGIAPERLDHVFDPFYTTKGRHGTGLGLAVTWGIVEGHAGTIAVESAPGRGTRFTVLLPCSLAAAPVAPQRTPMPDARGEAVRGAA